MEVFGRRLPNGWLEVVERDGYYSANLGPLKATDLLRIAAQVATVRPGLAYSLARIKPRDGAYDTPSTDGVVPFHNDGLLQDEMPDFILLYCEVAGDYGGETLLVRSDLVLDRMDSGLREFVTRTQFRLRVGTRTRTRRLIAEHPRDGREVLLFLDPDAARGCDISVGDEPLDARLLERLRALIGNPDVVREHRWGEHDLLLIDNYRVLHGRQAFRGARLLKHISIGLRQPVSLCAI